MNKQRTSILLILMWYSSSVSANVTNWQGFVDFNLYPIMSKVENDNTFTVNAAVKFNDRLSYFSLTNFSKQSGNGDLPQFDTVYTEQNLRWKVNETAPFDLTLQSNFRSGPNNDRHRLGIRWRLNDTPLVDQFLKSVHLTYALNWHAIQFDHEDPDVWQLEHAFRLTFPYISNRLYLAGFIDHTFNEDLPGNFPDNPIVAEAQLGYEFFKNSYLITEYRVNQYRRSNVNNIATGIEYKIKW